MPNTTNIQSPLDSRLKITIIGAGIVGRTIGKLIALNNAYELYQVCNSNLHSSKQAVKEIGAGNPISSFDALLPTDIIILGTPDNVSAHVAAELYHHINSKTVLIYFSGMLKLSTFNQLNNKHVFVSRIHPIKHMKSVDKAISSFKGTYCVYEGNEQAYDLIKSLFESIGAHVFKIDNQDNYKYHAASVLASAYHQILLSASAVLYEECGMEHHSALTLSKSLALAAIESINVDQPYTDFIEGPIRRADHETITKNLSSIHNQVIKEIYSCLGKFAISLTSHDNSIKEVISKKLELMHE